MSNGGIKRSRSRGSHFHRKTVGDRARKECVSCLRWMLSVSRRHKLLLEMRLAGSMRNLQWYLMVKNRKSRGVLQMWTTTQVCSELCETNNSHAAHECQVLTQGGVECTIDDLDDTTFDMDFLGPLRLVLELEDRLKANEDDPLVRL